ILDYSKYKYEQAQKAKQARKHQQQITIREIKFRPKIAAADYDTKKRHVERFLRHKDKVKITIMFRGREVTHPERGEAILNRLAEELQELAVVEQRPTSEGRNMTMLLGPSKAVLAGTLEEAAASENGAEEAPKAGDPALQYEQSQMISSTPIRRASACALPARSGASRRSIRRRASALPAGSLASRCQSIARFSACSEAESLPQRSQRYEPQKTPRTCPSSQCCSATTPGLGLGEQWVAG